ncbi:hypothetical protein MLD38_029273 [Melastoma candidum]|uniref:Uncharacterized protein n=1 Tax=Melastoma candidum TaxID=119954 RepID=A0ACB9N5Q9_9MYRT|nr:hypothetical protein MLD38_029273 [Melastoma candidum]
MPAHPESDLLQPPPSSSTVVAHQQFVVYVHVTVANGTNNFTSFPVTGIAGNEFSLAQFGTIYVDDDYITTTESPTSAVLGRSRGTITATDLVRGMFQVSVTFVFVSINPLHS